MNITEKIDFIQESFKELYQLNSLVYSTDWQLITSNCDNENETNNFFLLALSDKDRMNITNNASDATYIIDFLGLSWTLFATKDGLNHTLSYTVLGPAFPTEISDEIIKTKLDVKGMSLSSQIKLMKILNVIPTISRLELMDLTRLLFFSHHNRKIQVFYYYYVDDNAQSSSKKGSGTGSSRIETTYHGSYSYEQEMLRVVREGDISRINIIGSQGQLPEYGEVGMLAPGDPVRQSKNSFIIMSSLVARAAIEGGIPADTAYSLCDYYIQKIEAAKSNSELLLIPAELFYDFTSQVHSLKKESTCSNVVSTAIYLLKNHITDNYSIDDIARELGYSTYYLTNLIKKETGKSYKQIVKHEKIAQAKNLLSNSLAEISEISEELKFTSPSYFISVFKKETGMTPNEWRNKKD